MQLSLAMQRSQVIEPGKSYKDYNTQEMKVVMTGSRRRED
jgi:hypothetical protein